MERVLPVAWAREFKEIDSEIEMLSRLRRLLGSNFLLVTAFGAGMAILLSLLCRNNGLKPAVPVVFLFALIPSTYVSGRVASLAVATVAGFVFAVCLFEPYGSLALRYGVDRAELLCFALAAIGIILFSPNANSGASGRGSLSSSFRPRAGQLESWIAVVGYAIVLTAMVTLLLNMWK